LWGETLPLWRKFVDWISTDDARLDDPAYFDRHHPDPEDGQDRVDLWLDLIERQQQRTAEAPLDDVRAESALARPRDRNLVPPRPDTASSKGSEPQIAAQRGHKPHRFYSA
jgi:hypothetical protein